eukprot:1433455-Rhodomonas_salina.4
MNRPPPQPSPLLLDPLAPDTVSPATLDGVPDFLELRLEGCARLRAAPCLESESDTSFRESRDSAPVWLGAW